jgi:Ca-activated chloride channel family protein
MVSGMSLAYGMAERQVAPTTTTRVLVFTDGDANIGATSPAEILASVKKAVAKGVTLTTVGFGMGNYRDSTLERLADSGNGQSVYIDSITEARRVFSRDVASTLEYIAKDVKVQVDFDADAVSEYRLVGYENRDVRDQDFRNDEVDGGELGAGHSVTALYEVALNPKAGFLGRVTVRGQRPDGRGAFEVSQPMKRDQLAPTLADASTELRFATAVALCADVLRGNGGAADWPLPRIVDLAREATASRPEREEFVALMSSVLKLQQGGAPVAARSQGGAY